KSWSTSWAARSGSRRTFSIIQSSASDSCCSGKAALPRSTSSASRSSHSARSTTSDTLAGVKRLVVDVERKLALVGTAEGRRVSEWYLPTRLRVVGAAVPDLRRIARELGREVRDWPAAQVIALVKALAASRGFETRAVAYEILARHKPARAALTARTLEQL